MEIEVYEDSQHPFQSGTTTGYRFRNEAGIEEPIGTVTMVHSEGLVMAFNINPDFHGKGLGRKAFTMGFKKYAAISEIRYIKGSWRFDIEFAHLDQGESTNLTLYKEARANGLDQTQAALSTPTGKWASALGYDQVLILIDLEDHVEVEFYKVLPLQEVRNSDLDWPDDLR